MKMIAIWKIPPMNCSINLMASLTKNKKQMTIGDTPICKTAYTTIAMAIQLNSCHNEIILNIFMIKYFSDFPKGCNPL